MVLFALHVAPDVLDLQPLAYKPKRIKGESRTVQM